MNTRNRRRLEMGKRALSSSNAHPHTSAGYVAAVGRLADLISRAEQLDAQQRDGLLTAQAANARKRELRRRVRQAHLEHVERVATVAARDLPELGGKFVVNPRGASYLAFRTAARSLQAEAVSHKDVLVTHGLVDTVLDDLAKALDEFDQVSQQAAEAREAHVTASARLDIVAGEIMETVRVLDGVNRVRFANDPDLLAAWESASNLLGGPVQRGGKSDPDAPRVPAPTSEVKPAA
jgi:hypothetical protein